MHHTGIKLFLIFLFFIGSACASTLRSPEEVIVTQNFTTTIEPEGNTDQADVKIFVQDANGKVLSETYSEGWKSSFYFVVQTFPAQLSYILRVPKFTGEASICLKLRKSPKDNAKSVCQPIRVNAINSAQEAASSEPSTELTRSTANSSSLNSSFSTTEKSGSEGEISSKVLSPRFIEPLPRESRSESEYQNDASISPIKLNPAVNKEPILSSTLTNTSKKSLFILLALSFTVMGVLFLVLKNKL